MALPDRVRVKLLSEAAGYISTARVMERDFPIAELAEAVVSVAGKNVERVVQLFRAGTVVVGDYRYRWAPIESSVEEVRQVLAPFPDPCPERVFEPDRCVQVTVRAGVETIELPREQAARTHFLHQASFWDALLELARERPPQYQTYSYRQRADVYCLQPASAEVDRLREAASLLTMDRIAERIQRLPIEKLLFLVNR